MTLEKSGETSKTVVFQSDSSKEEICEVFRFLISNSIKDPFYFFKNPSYLFKFIDYAGVRIRKEHVFIPRSVTTAPIYVEFENSPAEVTFRVSYLPVFIWTFFLLIPVTGYFLYQTIQTDSRFSVILFAIGLDVVMLSFIAFVAYVHAKINTYYFKRDVNRIVNDLMNPSPRPGKIA